MPKPLSRWQLPSIVVLNIFTITLSSYAATTSGSSVYAKNADAILLLKISWKTPAGEFKQDFGSGFVVSNDGNVLTASHLIPKSIPDNELLIEGGLGEHPSGLEIRLSLVKRSSACDCALLKISGKNNDFHGLLVPKTAAPSIGERFWILGHPLGSKDLDLLDGLLRGVDSDTHLWKTNALVNPGNSGGPVCDDQGNVVGMVVQGVHSLLGQPDTRISGLNFAIPAAFFYDLAPQSLKPTQNKVPQMPSEIFYSYQLSEENNEHPVQFGDFRKHFTKEFKALDGYRFDSVLSTEERSLNPPGDHYPVPSFSADKSVMVLDFNLTSGPVYDQRRGWIEMVINTRQKQIQ